LPIRWLSTKAKVCERGLCPTAGSSGATYRAPTPALYGVAPHELREDGVYPVAKPALSKALLLRLGSSFLDEYGARSSTLILLANSSLVLGE
jgi:hypothetical protein